MALASCSEERINARDALYRFNDIYLQCSSIFLIYILLLYYLAGAVFHWILFNLQ